MISIARLLAAVILLLLSSFSSAVAASQPAKIIIGVIPEINLVKQMERFVPLSEYLDKRAGVDIEIKPLSNYGQLYEELRDGNIDGGFFGSLVYGITRARIGIIPLVRPVLPGGRSTYTGILFVRKGTGINKPADMKGKTIALADPATTAGYLSQKEYFSEHGINMEKDLTILWTGSHEGAVRAVMSHQAEIGGAKDTVVSKFRKENRTFDATIEIINENPKKGVPDNTLAVRKGLDPEKRERLKKVLLNMNSDPEGRKALTRFGAVKFIPTSDSDFKPLYDLVKHLKIDLTSYPYKKEINSTSPRK